MRKSKKMRENNIRWIILLSIVLLFLFLILDLVFTGYAVESEEDVELDTEEGIFFEEEQTELDAELSTDQSALLSKPTCSSLNETCNLDFLCCDGLSCLNGLCQEEVTCIDSDGGKNYYLDGYISGMTEGDQFLSYVKDACTSTNEIRESYCENYSAKFEIASCPNGCEEGVCNCNSLGQLCNSSLECCIGFNCAEGTCVSQGEETPTSLENRELCTFVGHPCGSDEDCCSKNCVPEWEFLFWKSEKRKCGWAKTN